MSDPLADTESPGLPHSPTLPSADADLRRVRGKLMHRLFGDDDAARQLGRYQLRDRLGAGGMGVVHAAWDPELGREVAIKVILSRRASSRKGGADELARLAREARAMAQIRHPNVVEIYDVGREGGELFFTMELVHGTSLDRWLLAAPRPIARILDVFDQIAAGVAAAHAVGLLHRDLKPQNVLIGDDGRVRVADFGLARAIHPPPPTEKNAPTPHPDAPLVGDESTGSGRDDEAITAAGAAVGTPAFMSPEQHAGAALDERTDVYAWCATLYFALCARVPFRADSMAGLFLAKTRLELDWPTAVPPWLADLVERGLHPEPRRRLADMQQLRAALARGRNRGRSWRRLATLVVCASGAVALASAAGHGDRRCVDAVGPIAEIYDDATARELALAFAQASGIGDAQWQAAGAGLATWSRTWIDTRGEACRAAVAGDDGEELDRRMRCLDRQRDSFVAVLGLFGRADAQVVEHAREVVTRLPDPARCLEPSESDDPIAASPEAAARIDALAQRLAVLEVDRLAGRLPRRLAEAASIAAEADAIDVPSQRARAHLLFGLSLRDSGEAERGVGELELAHGLAYEHRLGEAEAEAALSLAATLGKHLRRTEEGLRWIAIGNAAIERYRLPDRIRVLAESDTGGIWYVAGDFPRAIEHHRAAIAIAETLPSDGGELAIALNELGHVLWRSKARDEALRVRTRAVLAFESALGTEHPLAAVGRANLAMSLSEVGRFAEAEAELTLALAQLERHYGVASSRFVITANALGAMLDEDMHEPARAREPYARALAGAEQLHGPADAPLVAGVRSNNGDVAWELGEYATALALHRSARATYEDLDGPEHLQVAAADLRIGHDALALGRDDEAGSALRHALEVSARLGELQVVAQARFGLAVLERRRDPARALALAEQARAAMLERAPESARLVTEWIAAQRDGTPLPDDWAARARIQKLAIVP